MIGRLASVSLTMMFVLTAAVGCDDGVPYGHDECGTADEVVPLADGVIAQRSLIGGLAGDDDTWSVRADGTVRHDHIFRGLPSTVLVHPGGAEAAAALAARIEASMLDHQPEGCYFRTAAGDEMDAQYHEVRVRIDGQPMFYATDGHAAPAAVFEAIGAVDAFVAETRRPEM